MTEKEIYKRLIKYFDETFTAGYFAWRPLSTPRLRSDIFNVFDVVVAFPIGDPMYIQFTTPPNAAARRDKIKDFFMLRKVFVSNAFLFIYDAKYDLFKIEEMTGV